MAGYVQPGDVLADKYLVERVLGEGGMALVVAARHLQLHQIVAIKLMRSRALAFPDAVDRFVREAQTVASLRSENVARVMDVGTLDDGTPFMVMEHLEGVDLVTVLGHRKALAVEDAVDYVLQACAAMAEAHAEGIIHRDLKPGNLFLTQRSNGAPLVKVLDFGISKARPLGEADGLTETRNFGTMGSPPYMSPEQARSAKNVDERSDIWSLGIILYQLVSGRLPFYADSAAEVFAQILYEEPEPLHFVAPWAPPKFSAVVMRCLEKEPDERYQSVTDLAAVLTRFASPEGRLLVDAALVRSLKGRSLSAEMARLSAELDDEEDTQVDPGQGSRVEIKEPTRLDLSDLFAELPARALDDAYPRTTHAWYTGELAGRRRGGLSGRRAIWVGAVLALAGAAAAVLVLLRHPAEGVLPAPAATPPVESIAPVEASAEESDTAANDPAAAAVEAEDEAAADEAEPDAGPGQAAAVEASADEAAGDTDDRTQDERAAARGEDRAAHKQGARASRAKKRRSSPPKRRRRNKRKKSPRSRESSKPRETPDPFGTIR